jgi:hypothetical protein
MATDEDTNELDGAQASNGAADGEESLLKGAAKVATLGAVVGAAFGAARAVTTRQPQADDASAPESDEAEEAPEPEGGDGTRSEVSDRAEPDDPGWDDDEDEDEDEAEPYEPAAESVGAARTEPHGRDGDAPDEREADEDSADEKASREASRDGGGAAVQLIRRAREQLAEVTGRTPEAVLGLEKRDDGWLVTVEMLELARIPNSTDVLAAYEAHLDGDGELLEYTRTQRYHRGRTGGEEGS